VPISQLGFGKATKYGNRLGVYYHDFWLQSRPADSNFDEFIWIETESRQGPSSVNFSKAKGTNDFASVRFEISQILH
jgi:hypothetical protein